MGTQRGFKDFGLSIPKRGMRIFFECYIIYTDINFIGMDQFTASGAAFFSVKPGHGVPGWVLPRPSLGSRMSPRTGVMGCRIGGEFP